MFARFLTLLRIGSIRGRILTFAVLATLVPAGITLGYAYVQSRDSMEDIISAELESASSQAARAMAVWIKDRLSELRVFAASNEVSDNLGRNVRRPPAAPARGRLSEYLRSLQDRIADLARLSVLDTQGNVVASTSATNVAHRLPEDWAPLLRADGHVIGDAFWDDGAKRGKMVVAIRVQGIDGRMIGALAADVSLKPLQDLLDSFAGESASALYVVKPDGSVIASSHDSTAQVMSTKLSPRAMRLLASGASGAVPFRGASDSSAVGSMTLVPQMQWSVVAETPSLTAFGKVTRFRNVGLLLVIALLVAATVSAYRFGLVVTRPLDRLTKGASDVAAGNLAVDLPAGGTGEVGALTAVFNHMVARLRETREELDAMNETLRDRNEELARLSVTDGLTGLYNRRYLVQRLTDEKARSGRSGQPFTVLMADVDKFKDYNDTFGHPAGDEVLKKVGAILKESMRSTDCAARYGGEEFCVLFTSTTTDEVLALAERIRAKIEATEMQGRKVTLSIGVASLPEAGKTAEAVVAAADEALYQAKREGRNRVVRWRGAKAKKA